MKLTETKSYVSPFLKGDFEPENSIVLNKASVYPPNQKGWETLQELLLILSVI